MCIFVRTNNTRTKFHTTVVIAVVSAAPLIPNLGISNALSRIFAKVAPMNVVATYH